MSLAQLVQDVASANMDLLMSVAEEGGSNSDLCISTVQLLLVLDNYVQYMCDCIV